MAFGRLRHLFLGSEDNGDSAQASPEKPYEESDQAREPLGNVRQAGIGRRRIILAAVGSVLAITAAFLLGYFLADDSSEVSDLKNEVASVEDELGGAENQANLYSDEVDELEESTESLEGKLHAERSLNGKTNVSQNTEFETDFDWNTAGTVGYLTMKPVDLSRSGDKWVLTIEAKNEGSEPKLPFCGDGGAVLEDGAERTYSGETVLGSASANCEELQPGLTDTFKTEFTLPSDTEPAIALLYGDYEQEEEAKAWALPVE